MFRRKMAESNKDPRVLVDPEMGNVAYVESFGFEWTEIDGYIDKETISHGHIFGRFLLPNDYFNGKTVVDIGCGNGRIGRLVAPKAARYVGIEPSNAIYSFPRYLNAQEIKLIQANGTDLPLESNLADCTICWGVLHHMDKPEHALNELIRITKQGGEILIFIYSKGYDARANLNQFVREITPDAQFKLIEKSSDTLDSWREVDPFYANLLTAGLFKSVKQSREWQIFQWFDGITPRYHWSLERWLEDSTSTLEISKFNNGCYRLVCA